MWTVRREAALLAILGLSPLTLLGDIASVWLLTTGVYGRDVLKWTPVFLSRWRQSYNLFNYIDAEYTSALRWAKWAGFTVHPPEPFGSFGYPFCKIEMSRCVTQ
jgi:hypothetical protein